MKWKIPKNVVGRGLIPRTTPVCEFEPESSSLALIICGHPWTKAVHGNEANRSSWDGHSADTHHGQTPSAVDTETNLPIYFWVKPSLDSYMSLRFLMEISE
ncbi:hypothetical protein DY000_02039554 [Brassica cretica]|uniref:Uncharacterized protein n=1 Tax=Brassica cretica TaxID=69181 RepID=A0ABQ7B7N5_BRACR|nr:hypothetical protein DY000_02039554 [Brassica cretica]